MAIGGSGYTCALLAGGGASCWGQNSNGELGVGNTNTVTSPSAVNWAGGHVRRASQTPSRGWRGPVWALGAGVRARGPEFAIMGSKNLVANAV